MTEPASLPSSESDPRFRAPVREGAIVAGKYVVGRLLGLGGMGAVFEARDSGLERRVALKILLPRLVTSPTAAQRFVREARAATRITSEHVVKLLEIETLPDGTPLLVMEYLEGKDLRALLRETGPLEPRQAVDYLLQALQAVAEGHIQAVVHRDLKPSNLFLSERADGTPLIKVLDFGIAKTVESGRPDDFALTSSEDVQLGSPTYMPPEQFRNPRDVDGRADIWALGVTLYELISGRVPFQGQSYPELVSQVLSGEPDPLTRLSGVTLPEGLAEIIRKCLEKDRELRYQNAVELAVALAPFGSEDARLSLTRVAGLSRSRTGPPSPVRDVSGAYEITLQVQPDYAIEGPHSKTASQARLVVLSTKPSRRRPLMLGALLLTLLAFTLLWQRLRKPEARASGDSAPHALVTGLSALKPTPPAPKMTSPPSASSTAPEISVSPVSSAAAAAPAPIRQQSSLSLHPVARTPAPAPRAPPVDTEGTPPNAPAPSATPPAPPSVEATRSPLGPSSRIEKLIERRH